MKATTLGLTLIVLTVLAGCLAGCAQHTDTVTPTLQRQPMAQPTEQAAQGVYVRNTWNVINHPPGLSSGDAAIGDESGDEQAELSGASASAAAAGLAKARAGFQNMNGLSWYIVTTGDGANTATPTQTGGTLTSTATPTVTANQEPTANVTTPIAVGMPGSAPQASGQGQIGSGSQALSPSQQNELRTLLADVKAGVPGALEKLTAFLGQPAPTTQPSN